MVRLNPLNDFMFLKTMGEKGCEAQLLSFLNAVLEQTGKGSLTSVEIVENTVLQAEMAGAKKNILDVRARLADNTRINIEVQLKNKYNMDKRSLYYWSREFYQGIESGQDYHDLPAVIAINILDFGFLPLDEFHTSFHLWEDRHKEYMLTGALELHFLEMPKFRRCREKDIGHNALHRWLSYFNRKAPFRLIEEIVAMDPVIEKAQAMMDVISRDEGLRHAYEMHELALMDERNLLRQLEEARKEAQRKGQEEGIAKGIAKGRLEAVKETAKKLKARGMPADQIAADTGLAQEEVEKL
jgi:predicted transposase/invertase (TIGR01784 family)